MKNLLLRIAAATLLFCSGIATSAEIDAIAGRYVYASYKTTLPNGASLTLQQLGIKNATLEILPNMALKMEMRMLNGTSTLTQAKILKLNTSGSSGYFLAQWPDMKYPVKGEFAIIPGGLKYVIRFTNRADAMRYGGTEEATLKRIDGR